VWDIFTIADHHNSPTLKDSGFDFIANHFQDISKSEHFLNLDYKQLIELIQRDDLCVNNEKHVFEAVVRWGNFKESNKQYINEVLKVVRFPLMSYDYLHDVVENHELVRDNENIKELLYEAYKYLSSPKQRRETFSSPRTKRRKLEH